MPRITNDNGDPEADGYMDAPSKGAARRRVDAYHEALRERNALRELEQPFLIDGGA